MKPIEFTATVSKDAPPELMNALGQMAVHAAAMQIPTEPTMNEQTPTKIMNTPELITRARLRAQTDSTHDAMLTELADALETTEQMRISEQEAAREFHKQLREWVLLVERNNDLLPAGNNLLSCLEVFFEQCHTALDGAKTERDEARDTLAEGLADAERIVEMTKTELTRLRALIEGAAHEPGCCHSDEMYKRDGFWITPRCTCFKSQLNPQ